MRTQEYKEEKKKEIMEKCFECYCDNGLRNTGIKELGKYCGMTSANLYSYFNNVDELIIQSTAYCMTKVEDDFMELSPKNPQDIMRFISEIPKWSAQKHGKKYRLMYQVYTHPKYVEYGKNFFKGVSMRYTEYAKQLSPKLGIPVDILTGFIFIFVRKSCRIIQIYFSLQQTVHCSILYCFYKLISDQQHQHNNICCDIFLKQ